MPHQQALVFALAAGTMSACFAICMRLAVGSISPALGALIVSIAALPVQAAMWGVAWTAGGATLFTPRGAGLMILGGLAAASTTVLSLMAYARGFNLSSSPLITATQMALVLVVGFLIFDEPVTARRLLALGLIALGIFLLQRQGV